MRNSILLILLSTACGTSSPPPADPVPTEEATGTTGETAANTADDPTAEAEPMERTEPSPEATAAFAASTVRFGVGIWDRVRARPGNLVLSPGSMSIAFAMTYAGARGETAAQMARVFGFGEDADALHAAAGAQLARWNDPERDTYELRVANRLFAKEGTPLEPPFVAMTRDLYGAPIERLSFSPPDAARQHINHWVAGQTHDRITELLPTGSLTPLTRLVLTNAVYFLGRWRYQFPESATHGEAFHVNGGDATNVPMMHVTQRFGFAQEGDVKILEMPYVGEDLSMVVILPNALDGLPAIEGALTPERIDGWIAALGVSDVSVSLPRFRIEMQEPLALKPMLMAMGMPLPFEPAADFSAMSNPPNPEEQLYIDNAYHRAFVEVTEAGTEAAAATAVVMRVRGAAAPAPEPPRFTADHPFLFLLRDVRTGSVLFMGRVSDPSH